MAENIGICSHLALRTAFCTAFYRSLTIKAVRVQHPLEQLHQAGEQYAFVHEAAWQKDFRNFNTFHPPWTDTPAHGLDKFQIYSENIGLIQIENC